MKDPVKEVMKIFEMFDFPIDRAKAEAVNKAVDDAYDKWQDEQKDLVD